MPRRRKRCNKLKQSLTFLESPRNVPKSYLSPVLAARNPLTAEAKALLQDDISLTWVSPQFSNTAFTQTKPRRRARRQTAGYKSQASTCVTRSHNNSGCKTSTAVSSKYRPLEFFNDRMPNDSGSDDDESLTFDVAGESFSEEANIRGQRDDLEVENMTLDGHPGNRSPVFDRPSHRRQFTRIRENNLPDFDDVAPSLDCQYPTPEEPMVTGRMDDLFPCNQEGNYSSESARKRSVLTEFNNEERTCQPDTEQVMDSTPLNFFRKPQTLQERETTFHIDTTEENTAQYSTPRRRSQRLVEKKAQKLAFSDIASPSFHTPSPAGRLRHENLPTLNRTLRILVEDTPEIDYNLKSSLRRRRELLPKKDWLQLVNSLEYGK
ncbi:uncharacterized protein [Ptychodera flava]|uniref:uncharacterized protein n=1 Tax=Ptychodera flava TaxID=63121 RepID=UPI003969CD97